MKSCEALGEGADGSEDRRARKVECRQPYYKFVPVSKTTRNGSYERHSPWLEHTRTRLGSALC